MALTFEWDEEKSRSNFKKHGLRFEEAKTVFNDPFAITIDDPDHSDVEERYIDIGTSSKGRLVVIWYTERIKHSYHWMSQSNKNREKSL